MPHKIIERTVTVEPTPQELARCFMGLYNDEQAKFLNECARIANEEIGSKWCLQLQYITDDKNLTNQARIFMEEVGRYAYNQSEAD